jgi:hypothetical protein
MVTDGGMARETTQEDRAQIHPVHKSTQHGHCSASEGTVPTVHSTPSSPFGSAAWRYNTQKCGSRFGTGEGQGLGELGEVLGIASSWGAVNRASEKGTGGRRASVPPQVAEARISMLVETDGKAILVRPVVRVCC